MKTYNFKTISKTVLSDLHTPVSVYLKVRDIYPESALLESSDFHERFAGIDLNSRFEISPALKDVEMLSRFIKELRK